MFRLNKTCIACPEQYDVYYNDHEVGYLRLRHGVFTVDCFDKQVYTANPEGDGVFMDEERDLYLTEALNAIFIELLENHKEIINEHK